MVYPGLDQMRDGRPSGGHTRTVAFSHLLQVLRNGGESVQVSPALFGGADTHHGEQREQTRRRSHEQVRDRELRDPRVELLDLGTGLADEHLAGDAILLVESRRIDGLGPVEDTFQRGPVLPFGGLTDIAQPGPRRVDTEQDRM